MHKGDNFRGQEPGVACPGLADGQRPFGIWTMDSKASTPWSAVAGTGTPRTGTSVLAATIPGRWAAPPAPAMMTKSPRASAVSALDVSRERSTGR